MEAAASARPPRLCSLFRVGALLRRGQCVGPALPLIRAKVKIGGSLSVFAYGNPDADLLICSPGFRGERVAASLKLFATHWRIRCYCSAFVDRPISQSVEHLGAKESQPVSL